MFRQISLVCWLIVGLALAGCKTSNTPDVPSNLASETGVLETEVNREGVFIIHDEQRQALPVEAHRRLSVGEGVAVDDNGRVTLRLADFLTAELLQAGQVVLEKFTADEQVPAVIEIRQNGGILLNDFNPDRRSDRRLTLQTEFATVTTNSARFMVVREIDNPLEWIVNLGSADQDSVKAEVQVAAGGLTRTIFPDAARWAAPDGLADQDIAVDAKRLQAWLNNAQNGRTQLTLSEIILSPANTIGRTETLTALPRPGQPFQLERNEQGAVNLTLGAIGLFGDPSYSLEDCNADGNPDLVIQAGTLEFDFRALLARALALDVTVINRDQPGQGALWAVDPAGTELERQLLEVGPGQNQTLSLRSQQPYHLATLALSHGCFLGFSLTPPTSSGQASEPRPAATVPADDVVVNILAEPDQRTAAESELEALPVNTGSTGGAIQIDGQPDDWEALTRSSGLDWTRFETISYDKNCAKRYAGAGTAVDLSGRVRFAYDTRNLYVAFQVDDDGYVGYSGDDENYFLGDSPQLSLDMDLLGDFDNKDRSADDWQVDFLPDLESPRVALWQLGSLTSRPFDEAQVATAPTATGYFLEAALPWSAFGVSLQPGERLGMAANVNDNDTPGSNAQECIISTAPERTWNDPTTWGTLLLRSVE